MKRGFIIMRGLMMLLFLYAETGMVTAQEKIDTLIVYFDIDKSIIDGSNCAPLDEIISNNQNITSIHIYGFTDFLGNTDNNRQLSARRTINARNYLLNKGISSEKIVISEGKGVHHQSVVENRKDLSDRGIQEHRIVQVIYHTKTQISLVEDNVVEPAGNYEDIIDEVVEQVSNVDSDKNEIVTQLTEDNLVVNNHIVLENILFYNSSDVFRPVSYQALQELLTFVRSHRTLKIEIHGHICCQSDDMEEIYVDEEPISHNRAKAVYDYLIRNGISPRRLDYKGFGSTRKRFPLEQNEYERDMNRRVEILILEL